MKDSLDKKTLDYLDLRTKGRKELSALYAVDIEKPKPQIGADAKAPVAQILGLILSEMDSGNEPTPGEIAQKLNTSPIRVGKALKGLGINSQNTRRAGKSTRIYPLSLKPVIEKALKNLEEALS